MARQSDARTQRSPQTPFVINIARLARRPGAMLTVRERVRSPSRIGLDLVAIEPDTVVELDLQVQSVSEGVLVTGTVSAPTAGECARCLNPVAGDVEVGLTELYAYPHTATDETAEADEVGRVVDDAVDLEQAVIDAVGLELPLSPVCRPDCPGLCSVCGVPLATADPGHHHDQIDPRFAKLAEMFPAHTEEPDR